MSIDLNTLKNLVHFLMINPGIIFDMNQRIL